MTQKKGFINAALYSLVVVIVFLILMLLTYSSSVTPKIGKTGYLDMTNFEFNESLALIPNNFFTEYNGELLTPEDFVSETPARIENIGADYATYRLVLDLPANQVYGIAFGSASYSMRFWIDGVEYEPVGWPDDTLEGTIPKTRFYTLYFPTTYGSCELVIQRAGFHHSKFGVLKSMYLGTQQNITNHNNVVQMRINIIVGTMLMSSLFFFGLFLFFPGRRQFLWFSFACFMVMLRTLTVEYKLVRVLLPDISWFVSMGIEYLAYIGLVVSLVLYLYRLYEDAFPLWAVRVMMGVNLIYAVVILFTKPLFYTRFIVPFQVTTALLGVFFIMCIVNSMARDKHNRHPQHFLVIGGLAAFLVLGIPDIFLHQLGFRSMPVNLTQIGMMVCVFANMLALVLGYSRTEKELNEALVKEQKMKETNQTLLHLNNIRTAFLQNITHEMKTPLTGIKALSQYVKALLVKGGGIDGETSGSLDDIVDRTNRLTEYVDRLLEVSVAQEGKLNFAPLDIGVLFRQVEEQVAPLLHERGNRLTFQIQQDLSPLVGVEEMLVQVLLNLIVNANRHSQNSDILLSATLKDGMAEIRVKDHGDGISDQLLPHVFGRGISGDGSTGLGLANCKEIIETHGGLMRIDSDAGHGTQVWFTIPFAEGEAN